MPANSNTMREVISVSRTEKITIANLHLDASGGLCRTVQTNFPPRTSFILPDGNQTFFSSEIIFTEKQKQISAYFNNLQSFQIKKNM